MLNMAAANIWETVDICLDFIINSLDYSNQLQVLIVSESKFCLDNQWPLASEQTLLFSSLHTLLCHRSIVPSIESSSSGHKCTKWDKAKGGTSRKCFYGQSLEDAYIFSLYIKAPGTPVSLFPQLFPTDSYK